MTPREALERLSEVITAVSDPAVSDAIAAVIKDLPALDDVQQEVRSYQALLRATRGECDKAKAELSSVQADLAKRKSDAEAELAAELAAQRASQAKELRDYEMKIDELKAVSAQLETQIATRQKFHEELEASIASLRSLVRT